MSDWTEKNCPRLIEVALPIREISAESVRDKSLRHGHISTLHLWWARRPLPASRAVVFASLVPDPDDPQCPGDFRKAVERLLKTHVPSLLRSYRRGRNVVPDKDPYRPYEAIPDTLRNRLIMFIAKWSSEALAFEKGKSPKPPKPAELLDDRSLVKWETSDPANPQGQEVLRVARELVKIAHNGKVPLVLDPFAGGGSIPLEAGRLGCQPIANDYNPVAYLILRATCEFPQKYGKPGDREAPIGEIEGSRNRNSQIDMWKAGSSNLKSKTRRVKYEIHSVPNVLVHDVEKWANWILERAFQKIGHLYPPGKDGKPVIGYLWARTAPCSNPSCGAEIPLLKSLIICDLRNQSRRAALTMETDRGNKKIRFGIAKDGQIQDSKGTMKDRGNAKCPFCEQITPVSELRKAGLSGTMGERMVAVIVEGRAGKEYRPVEDVDLAAFKEASGIEVERPNELILPEINAPKAEADLSNSTGIRVHLYGMKTWGSLFNHRQLVVMNTFVDTIRNASEELIKEISDDPYRQALIVYLGILLGRIVQRGSNVGIWHIGQETFEHAFGRQAIPMVWDYPEALLSKNGLKK